MKAGASRSRTASSGRRCCRLDAKPDRSTEDRNMRKAMIVWGGWPGHHHDLCASMLRGWLKAEGFEVRIETTTAAFADPAINDLSLIIPIYTMAKIEKAEALYLCAAVRSGVGLAGHHGGMCHSFR